MLLHSPARKLSADKVLQQVALVVSRPLCQFEAAFSGEQSCQLPPLLVTLQRHHNEKHLDTLRDFTRKKTTILALVMMTIAPANPRQKVATDADESGANYDGMDANCAAQSLGAFARVDMRS